MANNKGRKRILLFTYYWPPASSPGVQRWLKLVKFLPEFGWNSTIITPKNGSYPNIDDTMISDIPEGVDEIKTRTIEPFRLFNILTGQSKRGKSSSVGMSDLKGNKSLIKTISAHIRANWFIPDARKGWVPFAIKAGASYIKNNKVDLIITTGPPHSSHLIGLKLSKQFNLPWVADLRDPWTNIYYNTFLPRTKSTLNKDYQLESSVMERASLVTVVSDGMKEEFQDRARKVIVLPNGYDSDDFAQTLSLSKSDNFVLSYIGNLKENQNFPTFWEAISDLVKEDDVFRKYFQLQLTGNIADAIKQSISFYKLEKWVKQNDFVQHLEAVNLMQQSAALYFPIPQTNNNKKIITGKIFEYLASQTPLVSIGPKNGNAATILRDCGRSPMIDYHDKSGIKLHLKQLFGEWLEHSEKVLVKNQTHKKFSRKGLANSLSKHLQEITHG